MIIVGAKGFAKEVLTVIFQVKEIKDKIYFYDDVSVDLGKKLFNQFQILKSNSDVKNVFQENTDFVLGLGSPKLRKMMTQKFENLGGKLCQVISPNATIGQFGVTIKGGVNIMTGTVITSDVYIGKGVLLNLNCTVGHDSRLGDFVECSPGVHISGGVVIGENTSVGTGAVILPKVRIGANCIIGAGSVVKEDIPDNCLVVGVPGKIKRVFNDH